MDAKNAAACVLAWAAAASCVSALGGTVAVLPLNIDINSSPGAGAGVPASAFGGAAGQTGVWNNVPAAGTGPFPLLDLGGFASGATIEFGGTASGAFNFDNAVSGGDYALLLEDGRRVAAGQTLTFTVRGLPAGVYEVYCYAISPDNAAAMCTPATRSSDFSTALGAPVGGAMPANALTAGVTHNRTTIVIAPGRTLEGSIAQPAGSTIGSLSGIQIKPVTAPARLYVGAPAVSAGYYTGEDWAHAIPELRDALAAASALGGTTEVWVKNGTYKPTAGTERWPNFWIGSGLTVRGGFAGTETAAAQRTVSGESATYLDGDIGAPGVVGDNSYHVVMMGGTGALDWVTVRSGNTEGDSTREGGGVYVQGSGVTLQDVTCRGNRAFAGGGVYAFISNLTMTRCRVIGNQTFGWTAANRSFGAGVALSNGTLNMRNCVITGNQGQAIGAGVYANGTGGTIVGCLIAGNSSSDSVAALELMGPAGTTNAFTVLNCTIAENTCTGGSALGAVDLVRGRHTLRNCVLWGNRTLASSLQAQQVSVNAAASIVIGDTTVEGWSGTIVGTSSDGLNPRLVRADGTYRLRPGSPAIDRGLNAPLPADYTTDVYAMARRVDDPAMADAAGNTGPSVDRGAAESQVRSCIADIAMLGGAAVPDGIVTPDDLIGYLGSFFAGDLWVADLVALGGAANPDNQITVDDLIAFLAAFFAGCP